ncbi:crossover junction endodeoxyribonuclease RuvC [Bowdeniella nasicola]|uniref:Crossover junction endodeoxyribonuclease RuvC n=1 Tax=Bowdeniella nasicola TaxID=208480 RepID=A0A1Q5Q516_9ACTO|nr:crossover junction endodeoxyribonuclease RuvC [Bowdeniella nasicola]OKL54915.1 crossover junction endodeoxyribonuclease RuvC [Bowdeniella nasicola]
MRIMGIDPGLTRCGIAVIEGPKAGLPGSIGSPKPTFVAADVLRTHPNKDLEFRLAEMSAQLNEWVERYRPEILLVERVFAQHNVSTVMTTAQVAGLAMVAAASRGIPVGQHTPSEVKAAVTGYGDAPKEQVQHMVQRILALPKLSQPADAADALALAICHSWRQGSAVATDTSIQTTAQQRWAAAERAARRTGYRAGRGRMGKKSS